jgi:hypothetical protein
VKLPNNEVGISDILQWRDCAARMEFGMRRHTQGDPPESWSPANAYGSAVHDAIEQLEDGATEDEAVQYAFGRYSKWLEPGDVSLLYDDLRLYVERDEIGVRTIVAEQDHRFPLFEYKGETIFFRFRLDRLYQRLDDERMFIGIDYKTSKWAKSQAEVDEDLQMWAYNVGIFEFLADVYPEIEDPQLVQVYDQLRYGRLTTHKTAEQREEMRRWLIAAVTAILEDEDMAPSFNNWCPWCPLKMDCPVVQHELTDFALARIATLAPREPILKADNTPGKRLGPPKLDPERFGEYVELLPDVKRARQVLEAFEEAVKDTMRELPSDRLEVLKSPEAPKGYRKAERSRKTFHPTTLEALHDELGPEIWYLLSLSQASLERFYGKGDEAKAKIASVMQHAEPGGAYTVIEPVKS